MAQMKVIDLFHMLKGAREVSVGDFRSYDWNTCRNGGSYSYWNEFTKTAAGDWQVQSGTSCEMVEEAETEPANFRSVWMEVRYAMKENEACPESFHIWVNNKRIA